MDKFCTTGIVRTRSIIMTQEKSKSIELRSHSKIVGSVLFGTLLLLICSIGLAQEVTLYTLHSVVVDEVSCTTGEGVVISTSPSVSLGPVPAVDQSRYEFVRLEIEQIFDGWHEISTPGGTGTWSARYDLNHWDRGVFGIWDDEQFVTKSWDCSQGCNASSSDGPAYVGTFIGSVGEQSGNLGTMSFEHQIQCSGTFPVTFSLSRVFEWNIRGIYRDLAAPTDRVHRTSGRFINPDGGITSGSGTPQFSYGTGQPNVLTFIGTEKNGALPINALMTIGDVSLFNGTGTGTTNFVDLDVVGQECLEITPDGGCLVPFPSVSFRGSAKIWLNNTSESARDSWCVILPDKTLCAWVDEGSTSTFTIQAAFGSLHILDIIPRNDGGFVTVGTDESVGRILPVSMDLKPGNKHNHVEINDDEDFRVAVLTGTSIDGIAFDATLIDPYTVNLFSSAGTGTMPFKSHVKDVNKDGEKDLILWFSVAETELTCFDIEVLLTGESFDGVGFTARDQIQPKGCDDE